ncbi:hypothetical protein NDU88_001918 [Pleurodeles waltl]|uniref:Uncharacterized protein n=1 Tax=Pleurodeles waltl TaxID=8319 RepID=A0AAV7UBN5_PLEWA|nr:hypothetical protein NDU88_001918 [Pleurodeles waltl]
MDRSHDRASLSHHPGYPPPAAPGGYHQHTHGVPEAWVPPRRLQGCVKCARLPRDHEERGPRPRVVASWRHPDSGAADGLREEAPGSKGRSSEVGGRPERAWKRST